MPRPLLGLFVVLMAVFGPCVAVFAWLFGALTCETGCVPGPDWAQRRDSAEWGLYWKIGVAFALCTTVLTVGACLERRTLALAGLLSAVIAGAALQWRVALVSSNSAADLLLWLVLALLVGVAIVKGTGSENAG